MSSPKKINSQPLLFKGVSMPFVIITMEELNRLSGAIADLPHRHDYYSVIWSLNATGRHIIDFKEYVLLPNHIFFVSPEQVHQVITDPDPTGYVILFTPEFLEKNSIRDDFISNLKLFRSSDDTPPLPLNENMSAALQMFAKQMLSAFESRHEMYLETIGAYLKLFLIECNGHCSLIPAENTQSVEVGRNLVKKFKALVEEHYMVHHQVKYYADALFVTPNYLNEVIRTSIDISAKDYIQQRLVLEAKRMIVFTPKSAKEIGYDLGFDDPSHFSKFFKNNHGQSLQDFRESVPL
ncbi:MAG: helix-turn-helix transcriptional regulator [Bacteroidota bacterium]